MARPQLKDVRGMADVIMSNIWDINLNVPSGVQFDASDINFRAISTDVPKRTVQSQEITIRGHKIKVPGDNEYSHTITLTVFETDDAKVHKLINAWREAITETNTGKGKKKSEIETSAILRRLNRQHDKVVEYTLYGVYLEDYEIPAMNETGEVLNITLTLSYDYFEEKF